MRERMFSIIGRGALVAVVLITLATASVLAQRRWIVVRPHRSHIVVYQTQPYATYRRPFYSYRTYTYGYPQSYYNTYYSNGYGYTEPYYSTSYYSYRYSQPYFANRYAYSWANPAYSYYQYNRPRHRHSRARIVIGLR